MDGKSLKSVRSVEVYNRILDMIFSRELSPGDRIPEERIAEAVGGSRTPVREALRVLASEGLVQITPRHCACVSVYDEQGVEEIGTVRLIQDLLAARLAIQYGTYQDFLDLQPLMERCEACAKSSDFRGFIAADDAFHLQISEIGKNKVLIENQRRIYQVIHLIQTTRYSEGSIGLQQTRHHAQILAGLLVRDYTATCNAICDHLQDYYHINPAIVESFRRKV